MMMFTTRCSSKHLSTLLSHNSRRFRIDPILLHPGRYHTAQLLPCAYNHLFDRTQMRSYGAPMYNYCMLPSRRVLFNNKISFTQSSSHYGGIIGNHATRGSTPHHIRFKSTITATSTSNKENNLDESTEQKKQLTTKQKAKLFLQKYGTVFIVTYISIYITTLLSLFTLLEYNILDPDLISQVFKVSKDLACETADVIGPPGSGASMEEAANAYAIELSEECSREKRSLVEVVVGYLEKYEWTRGYAVKMEQNPHLANLAVSWFMIKFTEPVRLALAFVVVPKVAKALGRKVPKHDL